MGCALKSHGPRARFPVPAPPFSQSRHHAAVASWVACKEGTDASSPLRRGATERRTHVVARLNRQFAVQHSRAAGVHLREQKEWSFVRCSGQGERAWDRRDARARLNSTCACGRWPPSAWPLDTRAQHICESSTSMRCCVAIRNLPQPRFPISHVHGLCGEAACSCVWP